MPQNKNVFYENYLFRFDGYGCDCVEDVIHTVSGVQPDITYKLQSLTDNKVRLAFAAKKGLVRISPNGTIEEENILGSLISLPAKSDKHIKQFMKSNGFIFPVGTSAYEAFDKKLTLSIIERLRLTVELMTAANEIRKDYMKIFMIMFQLLFSDEIRIKTEQMPYEYISCHHEYSDLFLNPPTILSVEREQEKFNCDSFSIKDSIYGTFSFEVNKYDEIIGGYSETLGYKDSLFKNAVAMYINYDGSEIERKITDVLFHYFYEVGVPNASQGFKYYATPKEDNISNGLKDAIIDIANYIVSKEINANIGGIHPFYDSKKMMPTWKIDSLLCAAYFSIFYLKPELELYRPCANPRCGKYFLVKTTATRKIYCSSECCNRVTQDRYRKNIRSKKE